MIDFGTLENHRVITQSLNHAEWDLVRVFVRKLDSNDIWMRFGAEKCDELASPHMPPPAKDHAKIQF